MKYKYTIKGYLSDSTEKDRYEDVTISVIATNGDAALAEMAELAHGDLRFVFEESVSIEVIA